jgi:peptidoglycan/LPS O-acetylase OafA/YrhL
LSPADGDSFPNGLSASHPELGSFRPDIEGLRAVAVLAVVLFHASVPGWVGGYVGVDVFFVISGFLITGLLWRELDGSGSVRLRAFYGARARRLLPASAMVGAITMVAAVLLLPPLQVRSVLHDGILSALYVSNYRFMQDGVDYFDADNQLIPSPFLHYWSLGVEEQFYLVWAPLLLGVAWFVRRVACRRRNAGGVAARASRRPYMTVLALVAVVSFAMSVALTTASPTAAFYSLPTRAWQLALGGLVALTVGQWRRLPAMAAGVMGWSGLFLILLACTTFTPSTPYPGIAALLPTLGAAFVIGAGCATPAQNCGRLLGLAPVRAVGRISYSWYLWHWPVLIFAPLILGRSLDLSGRITAVMVAAALAWLTLRFIENPLRFAPRIRESPNRSLALGTAATAIAVVAGLVLVNSISPPVGRGAPVPPLSVTATSLPAGTDTAAYETAIANTFSQVQAGVEASTRLTAVPSNLDPPLVKAEEEETSVYLDGCMRGFFEVGHPECAYGETTSGMTVALVGDSHAAMWHPALQRAAEERHWRLETLARAGCPFLDLPVDIPALHRQYTECDQWREEIITRLSDNPPTLVVMSNWRGYGSRGRPLSFSSYDTTWTDSLTQMVRKLRGIGAHVVVLGPIPDPQTMVSQRRLRPPMREAVNTSTSRISSAPEHCPVIVGNTLVYFDRNHMTLEYSRVLTPALGAFIDHASAQRDRM